MTFAAILSAAGSPRRVDIHATLADGWRRTCWPIAPEEYAVCLHKLPEQQVPDVRLAPVPNPGGSGSQALLLGGVVRRSRLLASGGSTSGCIGGGGTFMVVA